MTKAVTEATVADGAVAGILRPRDGFVRERAAGDGRFELAEGPLRDYVRTVEVERVDGGEALVRQTVEFRLAIPFFGFLFWYPIKRLLGGLGDTTGSQWWAPPNRLDQQAATMLGVLAAATIIAGYLNTLLTQTVTFAADEFHNSNSAQSWAGGAVRVGGMAAFLVVASADRRGRRRVILWASALSCLTAATGALVPSLAWLAASQIVARTFGTALLVVIGIVAVEEMPAGSRAYAASLLTMSTALGAGFCVMALPLADLGTEGWRLVYLIPLLGLPLVRVLARQLPESRRFVRPHTETQMAGHGRRFWLLAISGLLAGIFVAPASFFLNRYLDTERGFSAARISLLTITTNTPGAIGIVVGGRLADIHGRKIVGAIGLAGGAIATALFFATAGWQLWAWSVVGAIVGSMAVPALAVFGPELFPTSLRGRANGLITVIGLVGSLVGLLSAGYLSDRWGSFGPALWLLAAGPLAVALLVLAAYPETANLELEELNPEDRPV